MKNEEISATCGVVVDYIVDLISNRTLNIGDRLEPERQLAQRLNVSRATVREAINVLNYMGFICSTQGSGNYVTDNYSRTVTMIMKAMYLREDIDLERFMDFRQMLELHAFEMAVEHATTEQKDEMKQIVNLMDVCSDENLRITLDSSFHRLLVLSSGDPLIRINFEALSSVIRQSQSDTFFSYVSLKPNGIQILQQYHHTIIDALYEEDLEKGRQAIINHFAWIMPR